MIVKRRDLKLSEKSEEEREYAPRQLQYSYI